MTGPTHDCDGCRRCVPCAPGVDVRPDATIGVAHVAFDSALCDFVPCRSHRAYRPDEQVANLESLALDDDVFRFRVISDPELDWTIDFSTDPPSIVSGEASCTIEVLDRHDLRAIALGDDPQLGLKLYFQGRVQISGDVLRATRLAIIAHQLQRVPEVICQVGKVAIAPLGAA